MKKITLLISFFSVFIIFSLNQKSYGNTANHHDNQQIWSTKSYSSEVFFSLFYNFSIEPAVGLLTISTPALACTEPGKSVIVSNIEKDKATFTWTDTINTNWEVVLQVASGVTPTGSGSLALTKTTTLSKTTGTNSVNLLPNTDYEFFVRTNCGASGTSAWVGPIKFRTLCDSYKTPFSEGFNSTSTSLSCWTIIDNNKDSTSPTGSNIWRSFASTSSYEGNQTMYFSGGNVAQHDDWLMSPSFDLDAAKYYKLKYYYKTNTTNRNSFKVLLSSTGRDLTAFTQVLQTKIDESSSDWIEETAVIGGVKGPVYIAWQVTTKASATTLYVDAVSLEETNCPLPFNLDSKDEKEGEVTIVWKDDFTKDWEYVVQDKRSGIPTSTGTATTKKENVVTKDQAGKNLNSNAEYEFYVRSKCANGTWSTWSGPFTFRTACKVLNTPFWEGFNAESKTINCWTILDVKDDATSSTGNNIWKTNTIFYEGSHSMLFYGLSNIQHDDWLVSPTIKFSANKIYRLKYHYRTSTTATYAYEFEVKLSNTGIAVDQFTTTLIAKKTYENTVDWKEEYLFITGITGDFNIGWHNTSLGTTYLYIDNVYIEEVKGCPEPLSLGAKDIENGKATIHWEDKMGGKQWEYYVQEKGQSAPTGSGTATTTKENTINKVQTGQALTPNADYEFYVRTVCGNGEFSMWQGPYRFATTCAYYTAPFWEGFNTNSTTARCWTIIDNNKDATSPISANIWRLFNNNIPTGVYEGDRSMYFNGNSSVQPNDDWLISPKIAVDAGMYVLKYHYKTSSSFNNDFEVLLSTQGMDLVNFTTKVIPTKSYKNDGFVEEVVFFTVAKGDINIAWHAPAKGSVYIYLDHISLKKVENCQEPYQVVISNPTADGFDVTWKQDGGITEWEVLVVNYGEDETATPTKLVSVSAKAAVTITGLKAGQGYTVYVRAKCNDIPTTSNWSTKINSSTKIGANNNCDGAINIPVNQTPQCLKMASGSFVGISNSLIAEPACQQQNQAKKDIWFEFTATSSYHVLSLRNLISFTNATAPTVYVSIYNQDCNTITAAAFQCFSFTSNVREKMFTNLVAGQKYYVRLATTLANPDFIFNLCLTGSEKESLEISASGIKYSVEELVKDVLISSQCDLVSNVKFQAGDGNNKINSIGYFKKTPKADFPFDEGIVLATGDVKYIPGPHTYTGLTDPRQKIPVWVGDPDLNKIIDDLGGSSFGNNKSVSVLEFDFTPIKDSIKFEYLFASQSYHRDCISFGCKDGGALFAAWLIDLETGEGQNLALVPGTDLPIALSTIRDTKKSGAACESRNKEFYGKHYDNGVDGPLDAPINFAGMTIPMSSELVAVKSCKKYRIKLAIADFCTTVGHTSAVFFNAGSFDLGKIDLGDDLLVETNTAICNNGSATITSGVSENCSGSTVIEWYKNDVIIAGANSRELKVNESGTYTIKVKFTDINCESTGSVKVEIYPAISQTVERPLAINVCRKSLIPIQVDLTAAEAQMFKKVDRSKYRSSYYANAADAAVGENALTNASTYPLGTEPVSKQVYIRIEDLETGCHEVFAQAIKVEQGELPNKPDNVFVCTSYTLPDLAGNQFYYSESKGKGTLYKGGQLITEAGAHTFYILQENGGGCFEETSYIVTITAAVKADIFEDKTLECEYYQLKPLSKYNKYYTAASKKGSELIAGEFLVQGQKVYVYAESEDGLCQDESSFTIQYNDCPIPKGISPNGDHYNDYFDLSQHGVEDLKIYNRWGAEVYSYGMGYKDQWIGQDKQGNKLPDGTYYYVVITHGKSRTGWVQINR